MIKIFEEFKSQKYNYGDYLILLENDIHAKKLVKLECHVTIVNYNETEKQYWYLVEGEYVDNNKSHKFWVSDKDIDRKMNAKEIKQYKLEKEAKKYNL